MIVVVVVASEGVNGKTFKFWSLSILHFIDVRWESGEIICKFNLAKKSPSLKYVGCLVDL